MLRKITRYIYIFFIVSIVSGCMLQIQDEKDESDAKKDTSKLPYYNEAVVAAKEGDVETAIKLFEKAALATPGFSNTYTSLGLQYIQKDDLEQAEKAFNKAIVLDVKNFVAYNHLGAIMRKRGDFSTAKSMYISAIKHSPDYANAHYNIAILYDIYLYDREQALYHYKKYQSLNSDKLVEKWIVDLSRQIAKENKRVK